jgi:uncharacterized membrane protein
MNGASKTAQPASATTSANPLKTTQWALLGIFVIGVAIWISQTLGFFALPINRDNLAAIVLMLALATTLTSLSGQIPAQNVALATVIIVVFAGGIHALGSLTGIPFGPILHESGPQLFNALPWYVPFIWVVAILNSRGVARLILRPWRKLRVYGYWLLGISTLLTLLLDLGMEPFASGPGRFWLWGPTKLSIDWYGTPLTNFLGWLVTTLLILAFTTPSLMKKKPAKSFPDYHPLIVWVVLNLLFIAGSIPKHQWPAAIVSGASCIVVMPFAIRGARW